MPAEGPGPAETAGAGRLGEEPHVRSSTGEAT